MMKKVVIALLIVKFNREEKNGLSNNHTELCQEIIIGLLWHNASLVFHIIRITQHINK